MAKRFTETTKWQDKWFRKLEPKYKLLWYYILDNCDNAGIWEYDLELAEFFTGFQYDLPDTEKLFADRIVKVNHNKWFIPKFIEFQYGELQEDCRPHQTVIKCLKKYNLFKGYSKGIYTLKDKDKDKEKEKEQEQPKKSDWEILFEKWYEYKKQRRESYKSDMSKKVFEENLKNLSGNDILTAEKIIKQSMANNWAGIFELKTNSGTVQAKDIDLSAAINKTYPNFIQAVENTRKYIPFGDPDAGDIAKAMYSKVIETNGLEFSEKLKQDLINLITKRI